MNCLKRWLTILCSVLIIFVTACAGQTTDSANSLANSSYSKTYQFAGSRQYASSLQLSKTDNDIIYSAQVSNFAGKIVATVNDTQLSDMEFTIPVGEEQYYVTIASPEEAWLENITITVDTIKNEQETAVAQYLPVAYSASNSTCEIWTDQDGTVNLYARPFANAQALLVLPINIPFIADARTLDGWYRLTIDNSVGWVNGNTVNLNGDCVGLPVDTMIQPTAVSSNETTAPYDVDRHYFAIDINQGGIFTNAVSYPNGDSNDLIQTTLSNIQANRTIGIVMSCNGTGTDALRWGLSQNGSLKCGDTLELGFVERANDMLITVMLPAVNGQQYVDYQLTAMPIAPTDEDQHIFPLDRNQGGVMRQTVSYPSGDSVDDIAIYIENITDTSPNNFRQLTLVMRCNGDATQNLRWGNDETVGGCDDTISIMLTHRSNIHALRVWIPENVGQSFVDYTLYVLPSSPADDNYLFSIDRDYGGTFSETISAPLGDLADNIQITMTNLTATEPNNIRDMYMTLYCDGANIENVRWGLPGNPTLLCGQTVTATFTTANRQQILEVVTSDMNASTFVNYTLVTVRVPTDPITPENTNGG